MRILVLGGTAWLGGHVARIALERGHEVTCLARGRSGEAPRGARLVTADRSEPTAYDEVVGTDWDGVVDVSWQPGFVRAAVEALADRTGTWVYVSSCSVYAEHDTPGADESAPLLPELDAPEATMEQYGEAKVACERAVLQGVGPQRSVIARSGLIGGPGDVSDRTGYWPLRLAHPADPDDRVLVPDSPELSTQVIDVRDLAAWLVDAVEQGLHGVFNASGDAVPWTEHLAAARKAAGHTGELVEVSQAWLQEQGVEPWAGERSLPMWLPLPDYAGFAARDNSAAKAAGLTLRPLEETLGDVLAWELDHGPGRPRRAGLSPEDEITLLASVTG